MDKPSTGNGSALGPAERSLVVLSGALVNGGSGLERALRDADGHAPPAWVEEALVQSYLFLGYPRALSALARWRALSEGGAPEAVADDWDAWSARGQEVCERVYGGQYGRLRENVRALHPDLERWMVAEGYGKVLGRPGLPLRIRELCIVALLAVLGAPRQLYSHLRGAVNVGATLEEVDAALELARPLLDDEGWAAARATWQQVRERGAARGEGASSQGPSQSESEGG